MQQAIGQEETKSKQSGTPPIVRRKKRLGWIASQERTLQSQPLVRSRKPTDEHATQILGGEPNAQEAENWHPFDALLVALALLLLLFSVASLSGCGTAHGQARTENQFSVIPESLLAEPLAPLPLAKPSTITPKTPAVAPRTPVN